MPLNPDASHDERGFPATMWTVLLTARDPAAPEARAAREAVCAAYWRPVCAYLGALGLSKEDAEDATQTVLAEFTNGGSIGRVDPAKGRLEACVPDVSRSAESWIG